MSDETWELIKDNITEKATKDSNPIEYLQILNGVEVIIDNDLPYNHVEVYEKWMYEAVLKNGKADKE